MITRVVTADCEPVIPIILRDASGQVHEYDAVIDTGFTGWLTLPPDLITELDLVWRELGEAILANGSLAYCDVYDAKIRMEKKLQFPSMRRIRIRSSA